MADGRVFIAGGHIADSVGFAHASIYDPSSNTLKSAPDMNKGRWYPTATALPNGDVLVVSGDVNSNTAVNTLPQVYSPATNTWRDLTSAQLSLPLYPLMFVAPNGKVFNAGASPKTRYLDASGAGAWTSVATTKFGATSGAWRSYGPGVMYESGKVLLIGGGDPPTASTETIDLNSATPAWTSSGSMHFARRQHNAVVLPDGKVFVVGGSSAGGFDTSSAPVAPTEMWDPSTGQFTVTASIAVYRGYHSTALLLPDGRVLSAGGNVGGPNAQIYSPPYLFAGARPSISSAPSSVGYGQSIFVGTPDAVSITRVSFIRLGSVTHTFDQSARSISLNFAQGTGGLNVTMPANGNLAPPGYYMLFIVNGSGVPSVASIMHISSGGGTTGVLMGKVTNSFGAPLLGATVTAGSTAQTAGDGSWLLPNVSAGTITVSAALTGYTGASESVTVTAGNSTTAGTLELAPVNPGTLTGQVVNSAGAGIAGAAVSSGGIMVGTDALGNYTLANLPAGAASITASATGFATSTATVSVVAGTSTAVPNITLVSSSGTITGTVKSSSGAAIAGASVGFGGGGATTSSTGVYTINGVPAGTVQLVASASGFQSVTQNVTVTGGATSTANFTLTPVSTGTGTITGKVTNVSTGGAVSGATVKWSGGSTTTSSTGAYTLSGVTAGSVAVTATHTGYLTRTLTTTVSGGATSTLNIPLATSGKISVKVTASGGAGVSSATVTIKGGVIATTVTGTTSSTGVFTSAFIPIGSYTVSVAKTGHTTQTKSATVTSGATTSLSFTNF